MSTINKDLIEITSTLSRHELNYVLRRLSNSRAEGLAGEQKKKLGNKEILLQFLHKELMRSGMDHDAGRLTRLFAKECRPSLDKAGNFIKNLAKYSQELVREVIRHLGTHDEKNRPDLKLVQFIRDIHTLRGRGLYDQALKTLREAEKHGEKYGLVMGLVEISMLRRMLLAEYDQGDVLKDISEARAVTPLCFSKLKATCDLYHLVEPLLREELHPLREPKKKVLEEIQAITDSLLRELPDAHRDTLPDELPFLAQLAYYILHSLVHRDQPDLRVDYLDKQLQLFEEAPERKEVYQSQYIKTLSNTFTAYLEKEDLQHCETLYTKFENLKPTSPAQLRELNQRKYLCFIQLCLGQKKYQKLIEEEPILHKYLVSHEKYLKKDILYIFIVNLAFGCLLAGDPNKAAYYIERLEMSEVLYHSYPSFLTGKLARIMWAYDVDDKGKDDIPFAKNKTSQLNKYLNQRIKKLQRGHNPSSPSSPGGSRLTVLLTQCKVFSKLFQQLLSKPAAERPALVHETLQHMKQEQDILPELDEVVLWLEDRFALA